MIDDLWYKNAVIYSLDLETFMDGNGDGVGDFEGLVARLDYLSGLGVDAVWLAPFQPTPNRDNGYDVTDYYGVDPRHGSSGDFVEFVQLARDRGLAVLVDLVANHTSDRHPWFQSARRDPRSKFRDWYVWSKRRPPTWKEGMVFPGVQKSTWTRDPVAREWYYHRFYDFQPGLNLDNPDVRGEIHRVMGYWLQLGVAGFRLDALPFLIEEAPRPGRWRPRQNFEYLAEMRRFVQWRAGDAVLLGEANVAPEEARHYFGGEHSGVHMMFNFYVNQYLFYSLACGDARPLAKALNATRRIPRGCQWVHFLRNHDELDLGRLTDAERETVFEAFAPDESMQLYRRGVRRRLASMLGDAEHHELAYSLLLALPGTPVIRYGDEIGMGENLELPERQAVRTPMQWSADVNGGFSRSRRPVLPTIDSGPYAAAVVNVERQWRDRDSHLNWMVRMIRLRRTCPEIGWGAWRVLPTGAKSVLALVYEWRESRVVTVHNLSERPQEIRFRVDVPEGELLVDLVAEARSRARADGMHRLDLDAFGWRWFRVGGLGYSSGRERDDPAS